MLCLMSRNCINSVFCKLISFPGGTGKGHKALDETASFRSWEEAEGKNRGPSVTLRSSISFPGERRALLPLECSEGAPTSVGFSSSACVLKISRSVGVSVSQGLLGPSCCHGTGRKVTNLFCIQE